MLIIRYIIIEISATDLDFQVLRTCGTKDTVPKTAAIKPTDCILLYNHSKINSSLVCKLEFQK